MTEPLVSVIVPSYNQGAFIRATLESILQQDYSNIECIVMDGGSTDDTVNVLKSFDDPRLSWTSERDAGQSDAINKGLRWARGELLTFINSDDLLLPGAVSEVVGYLEKHPEAGAVFGDVRLIEANGDARGMMVGAPFDLQMALTGGQPVTQQGSFWRRAVMDKVGMFDETLHFTMDLDYWLRIALAGFQLAYLPGTRAAFRRHSTSKSVSLRDGFLKDWKVMLEKVYARPDLPAEIARLRDDSFAFVEWGWAKTYWMEQDYQRSRPLLKKFIGGGKRGRRLVASTMYIDSYLHTPLTQILAFVFARATGKEILFGERRAI